MAPAAAGPVEGTQRTQRPEDPHEGAVPAGYDWPTHGGYLGCLLGVMASCLLAAFFGSTVFAALRCSSPIPGDPTVKGCRALLPGSVTILLTVVVTLAIVVALGRLGFVLGKRWLREYPQPQGGTWGERDDAPEPGAPEPDSPRAAADYAEDGHADRALASPAPQEQTEPSH
jgi:hypothetical protein